MQDLICKIQVRATAKQDILSLFKGWKFNLLYLLVFLLIIYTMISSKFIFTLGLASKQMIFQAVTGEISYIVINNQGKEPQQRSYQQSIDNPLFSLRSSLPPFFRISIILFQALQKNPISSSSNISNQISTLSFVNEDQPQV